MAGTRTFAQVGHVRSDRPLTDRGYSDAAVNEAAPTTTETSNADAAGRVREPVIRVMVVDDHRMFVDSLVRLLADERDLLVTGVAASGSEALADLDAAAPDVVVLDYQLPDVNGGEVALAVRARMPGAKVVMLTGQQDVAAARAAFESGCAAYLTKDRTASDLIEVVRAAHEGRAVIPDPILAAVAASLEQRMSPALSAREREVLALLAEGAGTDAIAERLFISRNTVRAHVQRVISKLGAHSKLEAVAIARRQGLL